MSSGSSHHSPPPFKLSSATRVDDRDMLEGLQGLNIKNFNDCTNGTGPDTPSSTSSSLPTPPALKTSQVFLATDLIGSSWLSTAPNAPLLKDSDSFTDGTGHSTFDFNLRPIDTDMDNSLYPLFYHPKCDDDDNNFGPVATTTQTVAYANSLALDLLPPADRQGAVRSWVEGVSAISVQAHDHQPNDEPRQQLRKRRRSLTANGEAEARRVRAWTPTIEPSHAPQPGPHKRTYPTQRQEAPD